MYDYLIVGAGFFGSVCAHQLNKRGKSVLVVDKRDHIGGNCYTESVDGINVHKYGAHIFHTSNKEVWDYVRQFADFNHYVNSPIAIFNDELYNLPFNMNTFAKMWGIKTPDEAKAIIERQRATNVSEPTNLEEQAIALVGTDIYYKLINGYTEKQWGRKAKDLPKEIIKRIPLRFTYDNNYFSDPFQGIPIGGYTSIFNKLLDGIEVRLGIDYLGARNELNKLATKIIYTGAIDGYYNYKLGNLQYRSLMFKTTKLDTDNYQGNAVVNYTSKDVPYTRIIEHKHFEFGTQANTVITHEYPIIWNRGKEPYYPINNEQNNTLYNKYKELAASDSHVIFGGRLGSYKYMDMDKTIHEALKLVKGL